MKHFIYIILLTCIGFAACDFETSDNGDLDGYWQLKQVDTLATNGSTDMRNSGIFWSVQVRLLEIRDVQSHHLNILFRFDHQGNKLRLYNPIADNRAVSDSIITDVATLLPYGIQQLDETFTVESLNDERMVLSNLCYRFHFRKY